MDLYTIKIVLNCSETSNKSVLLSIYVYSFTDLSSLPLPAQQCSRVGEVFSVQESVHFM
jgi:hypothetical protein